MRIRKAAPALLLSVAGIAATAPAAAGGNGPSVWFTIDVSAGHRAISPLIYGVNGGAADLAAAHGTILRLGGNRWTAFNWTNNDSNSGSDPPGFENDGYLSPSTTPGDAVRAPVDQATQLGAAVEVTVPVVDWVAADRNGDGSVCSPSPCDPNATGYDATMPWLNGHNPRFARNHPTDPNRVGPLTDTPDTTPLAPVYQDQFVHWLKDTERSANVTLMLDNEPDYWNGAHPEVHPQPVTYTELWQRTSAYARALRAAWPNVPIAGPALGGWPASLNGSPDYSTYGDFVSWYLDQVHGSRDGVGQPLVSNLDFHWYPQPAYDLGGNAINPIYSDNVSPAVAAEREQRPRSLWDPSYTENSWITASQGTGPLRFLPRIEGQIAQHNPGMRFDLSEWSFGAENHISGAIADADALGIYGKYGLHAAMYWGTVAGTFVGGAFDAYRNYDGNGGAFGDTEVAATNSDPVNTSVYASTSSSNPKRLVIVAINKRTVAAHATINLAHFGSVGTARVYRLTAASRIPRAAGTISPSGPARYTVALPPQSVVVVVPAHRTSTPVDPIPYSTYNTEHVVNSRANYYVLVPPHYNASHQAPIKLLIWLHGCYGNSSGDVWDLAPTNDRNYIIIAPGGRDYTQKNPGPTQGCWLTNPGPESHSDVPRVLHALADVKRHFNIDPRRVIIGGYSSGGDLAYRTIFYHANLFAGIIATNTTPFRDTGSTQAQSLHAAATRFPVYHLAHAQDQTYPLATVRRELGAMARAGFPVKLVVVPGTHWDDPPPNACGCPGTLKDWWTYLVPRVQHSTWLGPRR